MDQCDISDYYDFDIMDSKWDYVDSSKDNLKNITKFIDENMNDLKKSLLSKITYKEDANQLDNLIERIETLADKIIIPPAKKEDKSKKNLEFILKTIEKYKQDIEEKGETEEDNSKTTATNSPYVSYLAASEVAADKTSHNKYEVQCYPFPGFNETRFTELPKSIETKAVFHEIIETNGFGEGLGKFIRKAFMSEASQAMLYDTFWWIHIQYFQKDRNDIEKLKNENFQKRLWNRIASSFVSLSISIHPDMKDKILNTYTICLSQAVFATFFRAFPNSNQLFDENFAKSITTLLYEWMTGYIPQFQLFKTWKAFTAIKKRYRVDLKDDKKTNKSVDINRLFAANFLEETNQDNKINVEARDEVQRTETRTYENTKKNEKISQILNLKNISPLLYHYMNIQNNE